MDKKYEQTFVIAQDIERHSLAEAYRRLGPAHSYQLICGERCYYTGRRIMQEINNRPGGPFDPTFAVFMDAGLDPNEWYVKAENYDTGWVSSIGCVGYI